MKRELTPKKTIFDGEKIQEAHNRFEPLINVPNNLKLIEKLNLVFAEQFNNSEVTGGVSMQFVKNVISWGFLEDQVLKNAIYLYQYHKQPQKAITWVKRNLRMFQGDVKQIIKDIFLDVLQDKRRFDISNEYLNYIIEEFQNLDVNEDFVSDIPDGMSEFAYFYGSDTIPSDPFLKDRITAFGQTYALLKTQKEIQLDYVKENFTPVFLEALNELEVGKYLTNKALAKETESYKISDRSITPIKWQKDSVLLAYLINELKEAAFIDETNIWTICEQIFIDKKGQPIKATTFTSMVKNYQNNQNIEGRRGKPKNHTKISEIISILKEVVKKHSS